MRRLEKRYFKVKKEEPVKFLSYTFELVSFHFKAFVFENERRELQVLVHCFISDDLLGHDTSFLFYLITSECAVCNVSAATSFEIAAILFKAAFIS